MSKRMKHVFKGREVFHVYANQPEGQEYGSAGNMSFKGNIAYSYGHYAIANIVDPAKKRVLIQVNTYSVTTAGHITCVRSALSHYDRLCVPDVGKYGIDLAMHKNNIEYFLNQFNVYCNKNKHSLSYEYYTEAIQMLKDAKTYCQWFKCKSKLPSQYRKFLNTDMTELKVLLENKRLEIEMRETRLQSPEHQTKLKAKYQVQIDKLTEAINLFNKEYPLSIEQWKGHELNSIPYFNDYKYSQNARNHVTVKPIYTYNAYLRLNKDKTRVETSKGAQVLTEHAIKIWEVIKRSYDKQVVYPGNGFKIDYYTVTKIDCGNLVIGCHNIQYSEMECIAKQLNLI